MALPNLFTLVSVESCSHQDLRTVLKYLCNSTVAPGSGSLPNREHRKGQYACLWQPELLCIQAEYTIYGPDLLHIKVRQLYIS